MNKETRTLRKQAAVEQIKLLNILVEAIDAADEFHEQLIQRDKLIAQYSSDLQLAQDRIAQQNKEIAEKNQQFNQALAELEELKSNPTLEELDKTIPPEEEYVRNSRI